MCIYIYIYIYMYIYIGMKSLVEIEGYQNIHDDTVKRLGSGASHVASGKVLWICIYVYICLHIYIYEYTLV
jgi:hypothetical protein